MLCRTYHDAAQGLPSLTRNKHSSSLSSDTSAPCLGNDPSSVTQKDQHTCPREVSQKGPIPSRTHSSEIGIWMASSYVDASWVAIPSITLFCKQRWLLSLVHPILICILQGDLFHINPILPDLVPEDDSRCQISQPICLLAFLALHHPQITKHILLPEFVTETPDVTRFRRGSGACHEDIPRLAGAVGPHPGWGLSMATCPQQGAAEAACEHQDGKENYTCWARGQYRLLSETLIHSHTSVLL